MQFGIQKIISNHIDIEKRIQKACNQASLDRQDVELIAVSKRQELERVQTSLNNGLRVYGENQVQEALSRWLPIKPLYADLKLHLVGSLQSNKAADAVRLFDVIHTIDREKIAKIISLEMKKQNKRLECFIQINTGYEEQKSGIDPSQALAFADMCSHDYDIPILGFMCIPPVDEDASPHFGYLKKLASTAGLKCLSMGMSSDFEDAIRLGATHIRIGSALFGERTR